MDAFTVQQYVANWLEAGQIPGLDKVWEALPSADGLNFADFGAGQMRCEAVVYVTTEPEIRRSFGAPRSPTDPGHGMKWITYNLRVEFCHRSADPDWIAADRALKQGIVEGARQMIRKDSALGTAAFAQPLFQSAGEGPKGITAEYEPPYKDSVGQREQWALLQFTANSWLIA